MPRSQSKITHHTKAQEELILNFLKRQSTDANTKMTGMLEFSDKGLKVAILKMLQQAITNAPEANEQLERLSKEIKYIKKNQKCQN